MRPTRIPSWKNKRGIETFPERKKSRWLQDGVTYFSANCCLKMGDCLGDTVTQVTAASVMYEAERPKQVILSMFRDNPLNFLWDAFISRTSAEVIIDENPGGVPGKFALLDQRRAAREVNGVHFDNYKESYRRLDCEDRYRALGAGVVTGNRSIIEMYYYGQEYSVEMPYWTCGPQYFETPKRDRGDYVLISPAEKCQGNRNFSVGFWRRVVQCLAEKKIRVIVNDKDPFLEGTEQTFLPFQDLAKQTRDAAVVACGNTGTMWLAAAMGTTSVICEDEHMIMPEYSARINRLYGCRHVMRHANPHEVADRIADAYDETIKGGTHE